MPKETNIGCKHSDPDLYRVMSVCVEFLQSKEVEFRIEERRNREVFVYFVEVGHLTGFIGRQINSNKIIYMITDAGRMNWAEKEGFSRKEAFDIVGVFKEATSLDSFTKWITGDKGYKLRGSYIVARQDATVTEKKEII